jgi:hypothetical protein
MARNTRHDMTRTMGLHATFSRGLRLPKRTTPTQRRLRYEPLEDRRLLSITVNTSLDELDGSIVDGDTSLRDARNCCG